MGMFNEFMNRMSGGMYSYIMKFLPFNHVDTGTRNSLRVERNEDGGLRVTTVKDYDTPDRVETIVNVPQETIERLMRK